VRCAHLLACLLDRLPRREGCIPLSERIGTVPLGQPAQPLSFLQAQQSKNRISKPGLVGQAEQRSDEYCNSW
jgi:hypothetical protein